MRYCNFCKVEHVFNDEFFDKRNRCRISRRDYNTKWCEKNKENIKQYNKRYRLSEKGKATVSKNNNWFKHKYHTDEEFKKNHKKTISEHYFKNKEKKAAYYKNYQKERRKKDPLFKLRKNLRSRTYALLKKKKFKKQSSLLEYIGCNIEELKIHLESQFKPGMTWDNYGEWHVDHKIPLISAKTEEELYKRCHYTNLQPLWAKENLSKGVKIQ